MKLPDFPSALESRINKFYLAAFIPLLLILLYNPFSAIIPLYGFLILLLKNQKLSTRKKAGLKQQILGAIVIVASFFVYYGVALVYPGAAFYGPANYAVYILGLFLIFFEFSVLNEAFAPLFLIVAAASSTFVSEWLKPLIAPFSNDFAHIVVGVLRTLGVNASLYYIGETPVVSFPSLTGQQVSGAFVYECIGVYSALVFSIILVVVLFEDPSSLKTKTAYSAVGLLGTFLVNIIRVTTIFLTDFFYGREAGGTIHYVIGYTLFSIWLVCFLLVYSKRHTINSKITSLWKKEAQIQAP